MWKPKRTAHELTALIKQRTTATQRVALGRRMLISCALVRRGLRLREALKRLLAPLKRSGPDKD
jgi:hypothetical protein